MAGVGAGGLMPFVGHAANGQLTASPAGSATPNLAAPALAEAMVFNTPVADLCKEERWKHDENPLDAWDRLLKHADADKVPDAEHTYRFKTHGLFYVAPAQDSFMIRLRVPACEITAAQCHGLADLAADLGNGRIDITTRGNLQLREFKPRDIVKVLTRVQELGLTSRGAGADNIRNVTASPDSGFAPDELLDVRPYAKALHHYILNHRDLYGLPRKFNVAFDNGGSISAAADTNDIGFFAARQKSDGAPAFRVQLGGITGHKDFAKDTGLHVKPSEAVAVAVAMIRVFAENGNRTDRKKARLKYLLEAWASKNSSPRPPRSSLSRSRACRSNPASHAAPSRSMRGSARASRRSAASIPSASACPSAASPQSRCTRSPISRRTMARASCASPCGRISSSRTCPTRLSRRSAAACSGSVSSPRPPRPPAASSPAPAARAANTPPPTPKPRARAVQASRRPRHRGLARQPALHRLPA